MVTTKRRSPVRIFLSVLLATVAGLLLIVAIEVGPLIFEKNAYERVPSIEQRADYRDPALMAQAWALPVAATYRRGAFEFQENQSFCGPTSIANLLRSTGEPTSQDAVIDGTKYDPWFGILIGGLTLDEEARLLAHRTGQRAIIVRDPSLAEFRALVARANDPSVRMIVNFHRGPMFGRGHGHFSPVLGYLADHDLVLVGDVNAEYRPYLVPAERLWGATDTVDSATGKERGILLVRIQPPRPTPSAG